MLRSIRLPLGALALALGLASPAVAQLDGAYRGIGPAEGMRLQIAPSGDGYSGALIGADGEREPFEAWAAGESAEVVLRRADGPALLTATPVAVGARVVIAPFGEDGLPDPARARALPFLREGVEAPPSPGRYLPPPAGPVAAFDARAFVDSFPFWPAEGTLWAYEALRERARSLIALFPLVQADLLWKLCRAPRSSPALAEALRGQGATCRDLDAAMAAARAGDGINRLIRDSAAERRALIAALGCADAMERQTAVCRDSARATAARAVSLETAATALARYR